MKTAKIFKEELSNPNIWKLIVINLGLEPETDVITVQAVKENKNAKKKD